ncbi:MAG: glycosyltransferase family 2 protein [Anaerolineae bacterium]
MERMDRLLIIVPCYNEADSIASVVTQARRALPEADVLVIDDGSTDATLQIASQSGATVLAVPFNLGIGGAVQTGYQFALRQNYQWVARIDGDGQHDPAQLDRLLERVIGGEADVVIGSRHLATDGYRASRARYWGTRLFAAIVSLVTGQRFTDVTSGFMVVNHEAAAFLAENTPGDYPEIEALVLLCRAGYRVKEVPVTMQARLAGKSSIGPFDAFYYVVKILLAILIGLLRRAPRRV